MARSLRLAVLPLLLLVPAAPAAPQEGEVMLREVVALPVEGWRARLGDPDLEARERAFQALVLEARRRPELVEALRGWTLDASDPGLAWSARLALRELRQAPRGLHLAWAPRPEGGGQAGASAPRPQAPLDAQQPLRLYAPRAATPRALAGGVRLFAQREGVTVVVTEVDGRGARERRYAAGDLHALLEEHPELALVVPGLQGLARGAAPAAGDRVRRSWILAEQGAAPSAPVLGVKCTPLPAAVAGDRGLPVGVGLLIERREPGTLAEVLDLRRGDVLLEVAGRAVCSPEELSRALAARTPGAPLEVRIVDRFGLERVRRWSPEGAR
jgi:hypothetical protein